VKNSGVAHKTPRQGIATAIAAAVLFGASTPLAKALLGEGVRPQLLAGLFYLRRPGDESKGGDLEILRPRDPEFLSKRYEVDPAACEAVRTVRYASNVLVFWVNSPISFHGTNVRELTSETRLLFNLLCEVREPLFDGCGPGARNLFP